MGIAMRNIGRMLKGLIEALGRPRLLHVSVPVQAKTKCYGIAKV